MDNVIKALEEQIDHHKTVIDEYHEKLGTAKEHLKPMILETIQFRLDLINETREQIERLKKQQGRGGAREGAGRPAQGITKKVSITLPGEVWDFLDEKVKETESNRSAILRDILINAYEGDIEWFERVFANKSYTVTE